MPLQVPLPNVNGVESLSGRFCYRTWCSLFLAAAGKYTFSCADQCGSRGCAGENLRESLISVMRRDWELCTIAHKKEKGCCTMLLQLSEQYILEERRLYHTHMSPPEEPEVPDSYTAMIRGLLWVSECYNMVGDEERSPSAWSVDLMTRTWMTYKANSSCIPRGRIAE
eukprot:scaffold111947_cov56-Attheya_sp.AAC.3